MPFTARAVDSTHSWTYEVSEDTKCTCGMNLYSFLVSMSWQRWLSEGARDRQLLYIAESFCFGWANLIGRIAFVVWWELDGANQWHCQAACSDDRSHGTDSTESTNRKSDKLCKTSTPFSLSRNALIVWERFFSEQSRKYSIDPVQYQICSTVLCSINLRRRIVRQRQQMHKWEYQISLIVSYCLSQFVSVRLHLVNWNINFWYLSAALLSLSRSLWPNQKLWHR